MHSVRLYLVTGEAASPDEVCNRAEAALRGGVDAIQLRQKGWNARDRLDCATRLARLCRDHGVPFLVNDDLAVALASGADGVHLGQDDLPVQAARRLAGRTLVIGRSTHSEEQAKAAVAEGADYIGVGPLWATPTKQGRPAIGLSVAAGMARSSAIPSFAIGGVDRSRAADAVATGVTGVAVVRAVWDAPDPAAAARQLKVALPAAPPRAPDPRLDSLGESGLLDSLLPLLPAGDLEVGPGDDAAAFRLEAGLVALSTDQAVEGVHFDLGLVSPEDVGWRTLALAAADIEATGGPATHAVVALSAPARTRRGLLLRVYAGMADFALGYGLRLVGGDTSATPGPLSLTVTVLGSPAAPLLRRDQARAGELVLVTGPLGGPAAGLLALRGGRGDAAEEESWVAQHRRPQPRPGRALVAAGIRCAGDVSDGLAAEARRMARLSGVRVVLETGAVPLAPGLEATLGRKRGLDLALGGGEETELCFTCAEADLDRVRSALAAAGLSALRVGRVEVGAGVALEGPFADDLERGGYQHFG
ncbi:MAG: thiamine-phosphate kinase [Candidatus Dormibacteria bacterium]